jgi:hypothetical protein
MGQRGAGDLVNVGFRRARLRYLRFGCVTEQLIDLVVEDQRQPGDAQQQQE